MASFITMPSLEDSALMVLFLEVIFDSLINSTKSICFGISFKLFEFQVWSLVGILSWLEVSLLFAAPFAKFMQFVSWRDLFISEFVAVFHSQIIFEVFFSRGCFELPICYHTFLWVFFILAFICFLFPRHSSCVFSFLEPVS